MAVNLRKGAPTSTNIDYNVARMSVLEYWTWCRLLGSSRTHRIHGSLARKSQVSECRKKKKKKKKKGRGTLPVRITWKGDWTSGVSLHCDVRVPDASRGQKFSTFFQNGFFSHVSGPLDNLKRKKFFPTFRPI